MTRRGVKIPECSTVFVEHRVQRAHQRPRSRPIPAHLNTMGPDGPQSEETKKAPRVAADDIQGKPTGGPGLTLKKPRGRGRLDAGHSKTSILAEFQRRDRSVKPAGKGEAPSKDGQEHAKPKPNGFSIQHEALASKKDG